jgi:hypothetical protein
MKGYKSTVKIGTRESTIMTPIVYNNTFFCRKILARAFILVYFNINCSNLESCEDLLKVDDLSIK